MRDRDLYAKLLGIEGPWTVRDVDPRLEAGEVEIFISREERAELPCPVCEAKAGHYDTVVDVFDNRRQDDLEEKPFESQSPSILKRMTIPAVG